jgi:L-threonylcarbamoyladenylate synthase
LPQIPEAAKRICRIKGRFDKPLPIACAGIGDARRTVEFNWEAEKLAEEFWPGPLLLVLPAKIEYSMWVTCGEKTLGVRVPSHEVSRKLSRLSGGVIVSTSANKSGEEPQTSADVVARKIGEEVDLVLDGGNSLGIRPSTVLDVSGENVRVLREGPVSIEKIKRVLDL